MEDVGRRLLGYFEGFTPYFRPSGRSLEVPAQHYLCGLMQAQRKNMERMAEVVPDVNYQGLHHFLSNSQWDAQLVMDEVARRADVQLGGSPDSCLLLDETGFPKKGDKSVGVGRQWCGRLGKVDNCQSAVFANLARGRFSTLIDTRLYLPKAWTEDPERCLTAGVPDEAIVFRSKSELALEMVGHAREQGLGYRWVGADAGYGKDPVFLRSLEDSGESFVIDVHKDQRVFLEDPEPCLPISLSARGRPSTRPIAGKKSFRIDEWTQRQARTRWSTVRVRESTKGVLRLEVLHQRVWVWDGREEKARCWHLIVSRDPRSSESLKYSLSNLPAETSTRELLQMQRQRFWIERSFQDAKSECGLGDYQVLGWLAWHHHMALVMMAMQFLLEERHLNEGRYPLLSCADLVQLLAHLLPRQNVTVAEVVRQMEARHRHRQESIDSAYRIQKRGKRRRINDLGPREEVTK